MQQQWTEGTAWSGRAWCESTSHLSLAHSLLTCSPRTSRALRCGAPQRADPAPPAHSTALWENALTLVFPLLQACLLPLNRLHPPSLLSLSLDSGPDLPPFPVTHAGSQDPSLCFTFISFLLKITVVVLSGSTGVEPARSLLYNLVSCSVPKKHAKNVNSTRSPRP